MDRGARLGDRTSGTSIAQHDPIYLGVSDDLSAELAGVEKPGPSGVQL
jgi:hypothetical protein